MAASRAITRFLSSEDARALLTHAANELSVLGRTQRWNAIHGHLVLTHELLLSFSHEPAELTLTVHTLHVIVQRASRLCHFPEVVLIAAFEVLDCLRLLGVFDTTATYDFDGETKTSCSAAYRYLANCTIAGDIVDCKTTMRRLLKRAIDRSDNSAVEAVATALLSSPRVSDKEDLMYYGLEEACTHMIMRNVEANCMLFHTGLVALLQVLAQSEYRSSHSFVSLTRDVVLGARNTVRLFNQATVERSLEVLSASVEPPDGVLFLQLADHYSMSVLSQARIINKHARNGELRIHPHIWQRVVDLLLECDHAVGDDDEPRHAATLLVRLVGDRLPGSAASASRSTDARHAIHAVVDYLTDTPTNMENLLWWIIDLDLRHDLRPFANGQPFLEREPLAEWRVYFAGAVERIVAMQGSSDAIDACQRRFRDMIKRHREWLSQQCCSSKDDDYDQSLLSKQRHTYHHFLDRYEREVLAMLG